MATSQQQCRHGRRQFLLLAAVFALVFLFAAGSASASSCNSGYTYCSGYCYNLQNNPNHCGSCSYVCKLSSSYKYGEVYCSGGKCYSRCKSGYYHSGNYCYKSR